MLDSIREIFDILGVDFESIQFKWIKYKNEKDLVDGIKNGKCPVADVLKSYYSSDTNGSHVMVATGIKDENGVKNIQLKNSFADNPDEQGKVKKQFNLNFQYLFILNFDKMSIIYRMTGAWWMFFTLNFFSKNDSQIVINAPEARF